MKQTLSAVIIAGCLFFSISSAKSVEGGLSLYLLGTRDFFMGIVPPPGLYIANDIIYMTGDISATSLAGATVQDAELSAWIDRPNITLVAPTKLLNGNFGVNLSIPLIKAHLDISGSIALPSGLSIAGTTKDDTKGVGDLTVTPLIGWHRGNLHYSFALPLYFPTGKYDAAQLDIPNRTVDVLNTGKNRFGVDPTLNFTYLDPVQGHEFSMSAGVIFNRKNDVTDYKTGTEFHFEATLARRFSSGVALGLNGFWYQQLQDDSGRGADQIRNILLTDDLKGRLFALGPVLSYQTKIRDVGVTVTAKYLKQFGGKNYFEGDSSWLRLNLSF